MKSSQVPFRPALEGFFAARFYRTIRGAVESGAACTNKTFADIAKTEIKWAEAQNNNIQSAIYIAVWLLLRDLQRVGCKLAWAKNCLFLSKPDRSSKASSPEQISAQKESVRQAMAFARVEKIKHYSDFIERMVAPSNAKGMARKPVTCLIGNGSEIAADLLKARRAKSGERRELLIRESVKPYLQLVNEKDRCEFTGHKLSDIWRFFRLTWANPPETTPGRTLLFLVRDEVRENHPVMGILSLENAALRIGCRDKTLGWDPQCFETAINECKTSKEYQEQIDFLIDSIDRGIKEIDSTGLCSKKSLKKPTDEDVKTLAELARKADAERMAALKRWKARVDGDKQKQSGFGAISEEAEEWLYKRKRSEALSKLLGAKRAIQQLVAQHSVDIAAQTLIELDSGKSAVRVALFANKNRHVGTSILELNVCGAVPPYNHVLGGKLAALLAISPKVVSDYRKRYGERPSDIASRMKGKEVVRPAELVFLGTTSLYGSGASQYNRLKIPKEVFGGNSDVVWQRLGVTEGYGTLHISPQTLEALENVVLANGEALRSNHVFGEGASPKFRSIRTGIEAILEPKQRATAVAIGKHEMRRIVFGAQLATNCAEVLSSTEEEPKYYFRKTRNSDAGTKRIVDYWMSRWLSSRIEHLPALKEMQAFNATNWLEKSFESIGLDVKLSDEMLQEA